MNLTNFLVWLGTGGSMMAVSFVAERIDAFQKLTANAKQWVMFFSASLLTVGSIAIQQYVPVATLNFVAPYFAGVAGVFSLIFIANTFHFLDKKKPTEPTSVG